MYIFSTILFLVGIALAFVGCRAMFSEGRPVLFAVFYQDWRTEAGIFGITGAIAMALAGYILGSQKNIYYKWCDCDTVGISYLPWVLAVVTFGMCGLCWFSKTKLAFWIDNRRWPTDEENKT